MPNVTGDSADPAVAATSGINTGGGDGVFGRGNRGVVGESQGGVGVQGESHDGIGVWAQSGTYEGVHAETRSATTASIAAYNLNPTGTGAAIFAKKEGDVGHAGFFHGDVHVEGELVVTGALNLTGADYAESMTVSAGRVLAGMVVVIGDDGGLEPCRSEYDTRVAGVVSGAGGVPAAVVLDRHDGGADVALMGKLWTMADATELPIRPGDLLTTSATAGHARRVDDPSRAFGAVLGKALTSLEGGTGLVRVLVNAH